jgi:hypothetical protein
VITGHKYCISLHSHLYSLLAKYALLDRLLFLS